MDTKQAFELSEKKMDEIKRKLDSFSYAEKLTNEADMEKLKESDKRVYVFAVHISFYLIELKDEMDKTNYAMQRAIGVLLREALKEFDKERRGLLIDHIFYTLCLYGLTESLLSKQTHNFFMACQNILLN